MNPPPKFRFHMDWRKRRTMCRPLKIIFVRTRHTISNFLSDPQRHSFEPKPFSKLSVCFFPPGMLGAAVQTHLQFRMLSKQFDHLEPIDFFCWEKNFLPQIENYFWWRGKLWGGFLFSDNLRTLHTADLPFVLDLKQNYGVFVLLKKKKVVTLTWIFLNYDNFS